MKSLILILISFSCLTSIKNIKRPAFSKQLTCILVSDKAIYKIGDLPKLKVEISNIGKRDIYLIGSLDGSNVRGRFPYCYYSVGKPKADEILLGGCGNMNTLRIEDFILVKKGQKFNPYKNFDNHKFFNDYTITNFETFKNPGLYKIKFHYSTNSQNLIDFWGDKGLTYSESDSLKIASLFNQVPKVDIESNEIEIRFEN